MHFNGALLAVTALLATASAQLTTSTRSSTTSTSRSSTTSASRSSTATVKVVTTTGLASSSPKTSVFTTPPMPSPASSVPAGSACAAISSRVSIYKSANPRATASSVRFTEPSLAQACLESVPLNVNRSSAFIDYIFPYVQLQSSLAYLKKPPTGYTLPGVDVLGGMAQIKKNVLSGYYKNQWAFEIDIWSLVNILPHDFHFNLALPLISVFSFQTRVHLISVSSDGLKTPGVYFKSDWDEVAHNGAKWTPSPVLTINGQPVVDYLLYLSEISGNYQDPDANYNQIFYSIPRDSSTFFGGAHPFGFPSNSYVYGFANGSSTSVANQFTLNPADWEDIKSGADLFSLLEIPNEETTNTKHKRDIVVREETMPRHMLKRDIQTENGYPVPVIAHPDNYTAGFFISNSSTAVLAMTGFATENKTNELANLQMQYVIQEFLTLCKKNNKTRLIVDVSANGGGFIFAGVDAFKQLFPKLDPYTGSRMRSNPTVDFIGQVASAANLPADQRMAYQIQSNVDANETAFSSWKAMDPPAQIYGDNFTSLLRYNYSDASNFDDYHVSGYLNRTNIQTPVFDAKNIVILYDGSCGSTCTIFSELMKAQGGVRSIAVGGRPQNWPMQGVAGSKGSQVYTFGNVALIAKSLSTAVSVLKLKNITVPALPPTEYIPQEVSVPLGQNENFLTNSRYNLRNAFHKGDTTNTPLQFVYEASNCKLFYKIDDIYSTVPLWRRAEALAWGGATCVPGSAVSSNNTFPQGAYDTVPFNSRVVSSVKLPAQPGLIQSNSTVAATATQTGLASATGSTPAKVTTTSGAESVKVGAMSLISAMVVAMMML